MAQFSTKRNKLLNNNEVIYEVQLSGGSVSAYVPKGNLNTQADAFGRQRISQPYTLFDSSFRFSDTERKWNTKTAGTASIAYQQNEGLVGCTIGTVDGDEVIRQTDRVFPYQPGKSLLILNTFTFNEPKENLRQRVGYFLKDNGIFLEQDGDVTYIVKRSNTTGTPVETRVPQSSWSVDKLDGTGQSKIHLDITKSQIFWIDIEWLGVGSVRCGFVMNGQFVVTHIFHHANNITGTYMTTATLSCRYEITNTGVTDSPSTLKQICSTVISEGGYLQVGLTKAISNPLTGVNLNIANKPTISIRLRSGRTDAVAIPREVTFYGLQATAYDYKIVRNATVIGGAWSILDSSSSVEYNRTATSITGGSVVFEGIFKGQNTAPIVNLQDQFENALQLTRDIIEGDSVGDTFTITVTPTSNNDDVITSLTWQEKTA